MSIYTDNWWSATESPKAWMSVRDADLLEVILHRLSQKREGQALRILEWGSGRSTFYFSNFLRHIGEPFSWLAVEHDRAFVKADIKPRLSSPDERLDFIETIDLLDVRKWLSTTEQATLIVSTQGHRLDPEHRPKDRAAKLDHYVTIPHSITTEFDLIIIDGRHRRQCLVEAKNYISAGGYVMLHDAWRTHYHCAWEGWPSGRRFGDEWWMASASGLEVADILPEGSFSRWNEGNEQPASLER